MVAIGTWQAGIFISADRGATWSQVPDSERVTRVTGFEWRTPGDLLVSTYGRGLWRVRWTSILPEMTFKAYCASCKLGPPAHHPPELPPRVLPYAHVALVGNGAIQGLRAVGGKLLQLFVSPGSSVNWMSDSEMVPRVQVQETSEWHGFSGLTRRVSDRRDGQWSIVGILLDPQGGVVGMAFSRELVSMALYEPMHPELEPVGPTRSRTVDRPYLEVITSGASLTGGRERVTVHGRGFVAGAAVDLVLAERTAATLRVGRDGTFATSLAAPTDAGIHRLLVRESGGRRVLDGADVVVGKTEDGAPFNQVRR
jgi:hypothetical protein